MRHRVSARPAMAATLLLFVAAACATTTAAPTRVPTAAPTAVPAPTPAPTPTPTAAPSPTEEALAPGYGSAPPGWETPRPFTPDSPLADPPGSPLSDELIGRQYNVDPPDTIGSQAMVLTLRPAEDPLCLALYQGRSTCFTILWTPNWPAHVQDPAVRGSARVVDDNLVLGFDYVPFDLPCQGTTSTFAISADLAKLTPVDVPDCSFPGFSEH